MLAFAPQQITLKLSETLHISFHFVLAKILRNWGPIMVDNNFAAPRMQFQKNKTRLLASFTFSVTHFLHAYNRDALHSIAPYINFLFHSVCEKLSYSTT